MAKPNTKTQAVVPISSSPSSSSTSTQINFSVKLTARNYLAWKTQLIPLLNSQDLMSFVDGSQPPPSPTFMSTDTPPSPIPNPEFQPWFKKDQMLLTWILSSLTEEIFPYIVGVTSSRQAWLTLANTFGAISQNRQLQLHIELQEFKKNDLTVTEYLRKAKTIADELATAGRTMSAAEFNAIIFRNIGIEYQGIISSLNMRDDPVTFNELHSQLVSHEILLKSNTDTYTANFAYRPPLLPTPPTSHSFSSSHTQSASRLSYSSFRPSWNQRNRRGTACQICGLHNHTAAVCRRRYQRPPPNQSASSQQAHLSYNFTPSTTTSGTVMQPWLADTGAYAHITPDLGSLHQPQPFTAFDKLYVGNGTGLDITHIGTCHLSTPSNSFLLADTLHVPQISKPLIFVHKFSIDNNCYFEFWPSFFLVKDQVTRRTLLKGENKHGLYHFLFTSKAAFLTSPSTESFDLWHSRLGHPHRQVLNKIAQQQHIPLSSAPSSPCQSCQLGKFSKLPFASVEHKTSAPFQILHSDVWGPSPIL